MLSDSYIRLRALEAADIISLYSWENLSELWMSSSTLAPYSHKCLMRYLENYDADPFSSGQLRLMIETVADNRAVGFIDLYNVEVRHRRASVGILIDPLMQRKGLASHALELMAAYSRKLLGLHQLMAVVPADNIPSIALFEKAGYRQIALLPDYVAGAGEGLFIDAVVFQNILKTQGK